jgi:hypothetical protein
MPQFKNLFSLKGALAVGLVIIGFKIADLHFFDSFVHFFGALLFLQGLSLEWNMIFIHEGEAN